MVECRVDGIDFRDGYPLVVSGGTPEGAMYHAIIMCDSNRPLFNSARMREQTRNIVATFPKCERKWENEL